MQLGPKTKIDEVLRKYPFIKDYLIARDPHFKMLDNPIMRRTMGRIATLSKVAMAAGVDVKDLVSDLAAEIRKQAGDEVEVLVPAGADDKIDALKGIIKDLHKGVDVKVLKERFHDLLKEVSPSEIAGMEQRLIDEGMPEEEVKRLCNVHVEVFRESLESSGVAPGLPAGHPVHTFMIENRAAEGIMREIEGLPPSGEGLSEALTRLSDINLHYLRKENQLFPLLEERGISGPSKVMWAIHDDIRAMFKDARGHAEKDPSGDAAKDAVQKLLAAVKDMMYKEDHILFPMALEAFTDEDWARVKKGESEIGHAWVTPGGEWSPASREEKEVQKAEAVGTLNLDTGRLTPDQVNLILTHLPVDVSFVNENDEVLYYSQTEDRIFPRSPGIIGRKVQNCHPPKSVHMVEKILGEFKAGRRDTAEFWIQMKGRFLHIRYFAVRDGGGAYRGTLEVSQDVTGIRALEGESRLLGWE